MSERTLIDARGANCPGPMMELIATLKLVDIGDEIEMIQEQLQTSQLGVKKLVTN